MKSHGRLNRNASKDHNVDSICSARLRIVSRSPAISMRQGCESKSTEKGALRHVRCHGVSGDQARSQDFILGAIGVETRPQKAKRTMQCSILISLVANQRRSLCILRGNRGSG